MERILFCKGVRQPVQHGGATAIGISHHGLNLLLIAALLQSILQLRLRWDVGGIVLVHLLLSVSSLTLLTLPGVRTKLYEFSRNVAMVPV
jgi:hypothetical protein